MDEKKKIFRSSSIDRVSSPEQLNEYIRVVNPGVWIILSAVAFLLLGFVFWGIFAELQTTVPCLISDFGICYVGEEYYSANTIEPGMTVKSGKTEYHIVDIDDSAIPAQDALSEYELHLGGFVSGEWVHTARLDPVPLDGTRSATIIVDNVSPITFVINN